ncbi:hypothetical protein MNQ98_12940 [Paenibacillus sp. N3/727]|uniref:hypothetical protein n=1 Tax=Paenibacillus sp. N3/727 TaxID=2925845 RepID=UPI001F52B881|nr:hypothetical protein [Paenibacillus sp. N3/727]UNK20858.1 hypothetical protein MNQ98_12940 [Paenibacillus sp. N3/727]
MREQTVTMIEMAVATALFMGACWFSFHMQSEIDAGLEAANLMNQEQSSAITTVKMRSSTDDLTFLGSEVLFMLQEVQQGKYRMSVDGVMFLPGLELDSVNLSVIEAGARYQANYSYSTSGTINSIQYIKVR